MSSHDSYSDPEPRTRPTALTIICVLAIVFGALGFLSACFGLISQVASPAIQQAIIAEQSGEGGPAEGAQREILSKTTAIAAKYNPIMVPLTILKILMEAALVIGGIMTLRYKSSGRSLLINILLAAVVLESARVVPNYLIQRETQVIFAELMPKIMAAQGTNAPPAGFDMATMMTGIGTVMLAIGLFWLVAKIVLYILGIRYLKSPKVTALFSTADDSGRY